MVGTVDHHHSLGAYHILSYTRVAQDLSCNPGWQIEQGAIFSKWQQQAYNSTIDEQINETEQVARYDKATSEHKHTREDEDEEMMGKRVVVG
jgi:hypothetical protein